MTALSTTQTVVMARNSPPCKHLALWLTQHCPNWRYGSQDYDIAHTRNQNVRRFLREDVPRGMTHLMMIDGDMVPVPASVGILHIPGDLVFLGFVGNHGSHGHNGDQDFGAACCRIHHRVLEDIPDPWFKTLYNDGVRTCCDCRNFQRQALKIGIEAKQVGIIGHQQTCILLPADVERGWALALDEDIDILNGNAPQSLQNM